MNPVTFYSLFKKIRIFLLLIITASLFVAIFKVPGEVHFQWQSWDINISASLAIIFFVGIVCLSIVMLNIIQAFIFLPEKIGSFIKKKNQKNQIRNLTEALNDFASGNASSAMKLAKKLSNIPYEKNNPTDQDIPVMMTHIFLGYIAYHQHELEVAEKIFKRLQEHDLTRMLGLRGLLMIFQEKAPYKMNDYVEDALKEFPHSIWLKELNFELKKKDHSPMEALKALETLSPHLDKKAVKKHQASLEWCIVEDLSTQGKIQEAIKLGKASYKKYPSLLKSLELFKLMKRQGENWSAKRLLFKEYKRAPHTELIEVYLQTRPSEKSVFNFLKKLLHQQPDHIISKIYYIIAAFKDSRFFQAGEALEKVPELQEVKNEFLKYDPQSLNQSMIREWIAYLEEVAKKHNLDFLNFPAEVIAKPF